MAPDMLRVVVNQMHSFLVRGLEIKQGYIDKAIWLAELHISISVETQCVEDQCNWFIQKCLWICTIAVMAIKPPTNTIIFQERTLWTGGQ